MSYQELLLKVLGLAIAISMMLLLTHVLGLAQTAIHHVESKAVLPLSLWDDPQPASVTRKEVESLGTAPDLDIHAFTILARVLKDSRLAPTSLDYADVMKNQGELINKYVGQWTLEGDLSKKVEELLWTNSLIYGVGGSEAKGQFDSDFFL